MIQPEQTPEMQERVITMFGNLNQLFEEAERRAETAQIVADAYDEMGFADFITWMRKREWSGQELSQGYVTHPCDSEGCKAVGREHTWLQQQAINPLHTLYMVIGARMDKPTVNIQVCKIERVSAEGLTTNEFATFYPEIRGDFSAIKSAIRILEKQY